ncbi:MULTISPECIES: dUTP diphosphatase [Gordonia]|uniref:dUTP diphosphatase n=1 Tax=Gordonia sihwensis NBRC 108236 TaxID=1223544 RepID=L7LKR0_9ACTN|nr:MULTISPECIES: dUTP diphosphatase [Gordonia]AUH68492.1 dUTP diphosphatase [Gordonia sp. YC-JH1]GAC60618.1 deoxyuridine 5'-triphosphate nucleotidohydrolase [Gordonia sihwensis NBRC 108236]
MTILPVSIPRGAPVPARSHAHDAGIDLYAAKRVHIEPGEVTVVPTGARVAIPAGHVGIVALRSSLAYGRSLALANGIGVIDAGYRGEIRVALATWEPTPELIDAGERIAQLLIVPIATPAVELVEDLPPSGDGRGTDGFGSSGR